ncbi:MAG: hypothetical protein KGZ65_04440 [Sphingomonadales bacterium]|nr:hypothetical protein [Sphingomonadaceae bacterium]MBS3930463.1 hypothetical protein [Sphingomonadales bacterium]
MKTSCGPKFGRGPAPLVRPRKHKAHHRIGTAARLAWYITWLVVVVTRPLAGAAIFALVLLLNLERKRNGFYVERL